jgi:predicted nucleic acid-binding protein
MIANNARYVVDTNVLIAASAADPITPKDIDATPQEPELRLQVWEWLNEFQFSDAHLVLDGTLKIEAEYSNKLGFNDFGRQVVQHKWDYCAVDLVDVQYDADGHGMLPATLAPTIHDTADRKMVAAALESKAPVAFAGDTDWHDWETVLRQHGVTLEPIIETWSRAKWKEKKRKKV